jgi:voltage-gated potassium channel Kch
MFRQRDWFIIIPLALLGIALGMWGLMTCVSCDDYGKFGAALGDTLAMVKGTAPKGSEFPPQLVIAEFLLPLIAVYSGAKILLHNLRRDMRVALASRRWNHVIVCGLGDTGREIVENLRAEGTDVVAIVLDCDEPNALACEQLKVPILNGDATQIELIRLAGLKRAKAVVVTTGSDAANIEVALRVDAEFARTELRTRPLYVLPEITSAWLLELLHSHPTTTLGSELVEIHPFDLYANAARIVLASPAFRHAFPARQERQAGAPPRAPQLRPHLLVAGLGEMGTQIIVQAVQGNFALPGCELAVTVFDQQGEAAAAGLAARFPGLRQLVDLAFVQTSFDADTPASWPEVSKDVEAVLRGRGATLSTVAVIVSLKEDKDSLHAAVLLRERLDREGQFGTPVFVRLRHQRALGQFAANLDGPNTLTDRLIPFGDLGRLTSPEQLIDQPQDRLARAIHGSYLASLGEAASGSAAVPWARLPERYKQSNRAVADHIPAELGLVGMRLVAGQQEPARFTDDEVEAMAAAEHWRWVVERRCGGWRRGPRDDVARIHPDLVGWSELSEETRKGNRARVREIPQNVTVTGMTIRRERIIVAAEHGLDTAAAALDGIAAGEQAIVVFDPFEPESWQIAQDAASRGARLWVLWHPGRRRPPIAREPVTRAVREAVETAISVRDLAELMPGAVAAPPAASGNGAEQPRARAKPRRRTARSARGHSVRRHVSEAENPPTG